MREGGIDFIQGGGSNSKRQGKKTELVLPNMTEIITIHNKLLQICYFLEHRNLSSYKEQVKIDIGLTPADQRMEEVDGRGFCCGPFAVLLSPLLQNQCLRLRTFGDGVASQVNYPLICTERQRKWILLIPSELLGTLLFQDQTLGESLQVATPFLNSPHLWSCTI